MVSKPDWTKLGTLQRCEQEYVWRHVQHLAPTGLSASAHFGQIVHVGVRALYDGRSAKEAQIMVRRAWADSTAGIIVANAMKGEGTWGCAMCGAGWSGKRDVHAAHTQFRVGDGGGCQQRATGEPFILPVLDERKTYLNPRRAIAIVAAYAAAYLGVNTVADGEPIVGSTQPYDCVWNEGYGESATESGLPDRAMRSTADGKLYAMDLKTTAMYISESWERSFEHSQQVAMQLDILEAELGERVEGFVLDAINVRQEVLDTSFVRYGPLVYSDALRAELRQHRQRLAARADELAKLPQAALKAPSACVRYNELCPYFDLCHADPGDREALVQIGLERGKWETREWTPSERD